VKKCAIIITNKVKGEIKMEYRQHLTEKERSYDKICGITLTNIFTLTKNCETIPVRNIDINNKEHLYVLSVALSLAGIVEKRVSVNGSKFFLWRLNKKLGLKKDCRITSMTAKDTMYSVSPDMLNNDMRLTAAEIMTTASFDFGEIYDEFYSKKGRK
jgi:hypothetical protein